MINYNDKLYHHGVKGMRWGVRKSKRKISEDAKEAKKLKKKHVDELSTKELKDLNTRQQEEKKHRELNPSKIKKGIAIAGSIVAALGTITALYRYSKQGIDKGKEVVNKCKNKKLSQMRKAKIQQFQQKGEMLVKNNVKLSKVVVPKAIANRKTKAPATLYFNNRKRKYT